MIGGTVAPYHVTTLQLYNGICDPNKGQLTYSVKPLPPGSSIDIPQGRRLVLLKKLKRLSLMIDDCPSNVSFLCCQCNSCDMWQFCQQSYPVVSWYYYYYDFAAGPELLSCPSNLVGTVISNACWDASSREEHSSGSCVACHSSCVDQLCASTYPEQCGNGNCTNSWYPGYVPCFMNVPADACLGTQLLSEFNLPRGSACPGHVLPFTLVLGDVRFWRTRGVHILQRPAAHLLNACMTGLALLSLLA